MTLVEIATHLPTSAARDKAQADAPQLRLLDIPARATGGIGQRIEARIIWLP